MEKNEIGREEGSQGSGPWLWGLGGNVCNIPCRETDAGRGKLMSVALRYAESERSGDYETSRLGLHAEAVEGENGTCRGRSRSGC